MNFTKEEIQNLISKLHESCEGRYDLNGQDLHEIHALLNEYSNKFMIKTANEVEEHLSTEDLLEYTNKLSLYVNVAINALQHKINQTKIP